MFQREKERTWVGAANNATSYCVYRPSADERPTRASTNFHPVPMDMGGVGGGRAFVRLWESQEEEEENRKGRINRLSRVDICMYVCMYGVVYCCCCPERYYISMWRNKIKYVKISRRIKRSRMGRVLGFFCVCNASLRGVEKRWRRSRKILDYSKADAVARWWRRNPRNFLTQHKKLWSIESLLPWLYRGYILVLPRQWFPFILSRLYEWCSLFFFLIPTSLVRKVPISLPGCARRDEECSNDPSYI